jgi:hypothetical protein
MSKGTIFNATDKLNRKYIYINLGEENDGCGNTVHLYNMTTKTDTFVEKEWFNQRKIEEVA